MIETAADNTKEVLNPKDKWLDSIDWDQYMEQFDKSTRVNQIKAVLGGIGALNNCTLNINISGNIG